MRALLPAFLLDRFCVPVPDGPADGTPLLEAGIVDSTGVQEVIGFLEEESGIRVENDEIPPEDLDSVDRLVRFVRRKLEAVGEASGSPRDPRCPSGT